MDLNYYATGIIEYYTGRAEKRKAISWSDKNIYFWYNNFRFPIT